jgi:CheY-like chemotaxis protein
MRVLLVEDDASCVRMIQNALKGLTQKIDVTDKLEDALNMLCDDYDALWLDLSLADSASPETLKAIPAIRDKCPKVTLLVVSGYGERFRAEALKQGADAYASKLDLEGFRSSAIAKLFTQAATHAMERGVDSSFILQRVSSFLHTSLPT